MGEVFRATDTRLHRTVAIKILPRDKVADPDRKKRFLQEARAASALNHPNIVTLYDIASSNGIDYLVMEYVPGKSLDKLIAPKGLPLAEALNYAQQIANGLAAAHAAGIVHRDMKPGNVMVTAESQTKILDFGLAKLTEHAPGAEGETRTQESALTEAGTVMGTVAYMSPEQASARPLDHRTDIFSLGVMLYEMLAGTRPFRGKSQVETMHAIIHDPAPPLSSVPPRLQEILEKALEKDPKDRYQHAGDLALDLRRVERSPGATSAARVGPAPPTGSGTRLPAWIPWTIAGLAVAALVAVLAWPRPRTSGREPVKFAFGPPRDLALAGLIQDSALSPDGRRIAVVLKDETGASAIWVRSLDSQEPRRMDGTDDSSFVFWSPDGQFLGFFAQGKLKKIALAGGPPQNICTTTPGLGATWSPAGEIVFNPINRAPLMRVSAAGGTPQPLTTLDSSRQENSHRWPSFLPDGRHFLFTARSSQKENTAIYAGSLDSKEIKRILTEQSNGVYVPPGYILFARDGSLMAQRFDAERLELSGEAFPVTGNVDHRTASANAFFSASADGTVIAYSEGSAISQLTWFDHDGTNRGTLGAKGSYTDPRFSLDGKLLALTIPDPESGNRDIWILEVASGSLTRFTTNPANDWQPVWSPDGKYLAFASDRTPHSSIYRKAVNGNGEEELLVLGGSTGGAFTTDWSHDGRLLAYELDTLDAKEDMWLLPLFGDRKPQPFLTTRFTENFVKFSPDSKTAAYVSNESGVMEVYVAGIDKPGKQRVSSGGGVWPVWRPDGKELYFRSQGILSAVEIRQDGGSVSFGAPRALFPTCDTDASRYDISPDGKRFLFSCPAEDTRKRSITVAIGWLDMLKNPGQQTGR
jgi:Tol biopolymer transport system component